MTLYYGIYPLITFSVNGSVKAHFYGVFIEITDKTFIRVSPASNSVSYIST
uniref:Uncharacterized protein n=1 Tax=Rhizophagus irregularis (strain DAOM 181602 / DAOM 197198 / MUCL 43194) TaxID=747089 RepID=U9U8P6_RHIID